MNDELIKKDYSTKIKKIQKLNKSYYQENNSIVTDQ